MRLPYNVNVLTQRVAERVLGRMDVLNAQAAAICDERSRLYARRLRRPRRPGLSAASQLHAVPGPAGRLRVFASLKAHGILIKNLNGSHPMLAECLRVTVGTPQENDRFVDALARVCPRTAA